MKSQVELCMSFFTAFSHICNIYFDFFSAVHVQKYSFTIPLEKVHLESSHLIYRLDNVSNLFSIHQGQLSYIHVVWNPPLSFASNKNSLYNQSYMMWVFIQKPVVRVMVLSSEKRCKDINTLNK